MKGKEKPTKDLRSSYVASATTFHEEKEPIYKSCPNTGQCFCTGECREIVGWMPKAKTSILGL